jgi:hypothetical protein
MPTYLFFWTILDPFLFWISIAEAATAPKGTSHD